MAGELMRPNYPIPVGWRMLIRIEKEPEKTAGGIIRPNVVIDNEKALSMVGQVVAQGPLAYTRDDMQAEGWCVPGDYVLLSKYAGTRFEVDGEELRIINDDEVQAVIPDPKAIKRVLA